MLKVRRQKLEYPFWEAVPAKKEADVALDNYIAFAYNLFNKQKTGKDSSKMKNFLWNAFGSAINSFMSLIYIVVVTRINGVDTSGIFSVCFSVSIILYTVPALGGRVFEVADRERNDNNYFTLKLFVSLIAVALSAGFCVVSRYSLEKTAIVLIFMIVRIFEALSDTVYAVFQKNEHLDYVGISYTLKNSVCLIAFTVVDILTHNILLSVLAIACATALIYFAYDKKTVRRFHHVKVDTDFSACVDLAKAISYFLIFNLVIMLIANVPKLICDFKYTEGEMGYFSIIMMIPSVMVLLGQMIFQPSLTVLSRQYSEYELSGFSKKVVLIMSSMVACAAVCSVAAYFLGPPILGFIMNIDLSDFAFSMVIVIIAGMFNVFVTFISMLLTIMRRTKQQLFLYIAVMIAEIIMIYSGAKTDNFTSVFVMYLLAMIVQFAVFLIYYLAEFQSDKKLFSE